MVGGLDTTLHGYPKCSRRWLELGRFSLPPHIKTCASAKADATATQFSSFNVPVIVIVWPPSLARRSSWFSMPRKAGTGTASVLQAGAVPGTVLVGGVPGCQRGHAERKSLAVMFGGFSACKLGSGVQKAEPHWKKSQCAHARTKCN